MDDDYYYYGDPLFGLIYGGILAVTLAIAFFALVASYVLTGIGLMRFFRKVGVPAWIAWVPIYNNWKWLEVGGQKGWLALAALIPYLGIVTSIFLYIGMYRTGFAFRKSSGFLVLGIFFPFAWAFILGGRDEVYEPHLITQAGFPPPSAGYGAGWTAAPYGTPGYAQGGYAPYPTPPAPGGPDGYGAPQYAPGRYGAATTDQHGVPMAYAAPPAYTAPPAHGTPVPPVEQAPPVAAAPPTNVVPPVPPIPPAN